MELEEQISLKTFIITHALKGVYGSCTRKSNFRNEHTKHADRTSIFFFFCDSHASLLTTVARYRDFAIVPIWTHHTLLK